MVKNYKLVTKISIHALREEGDPIGQHLNHRRQRFLSTPSARRATQPARPDRKDRHISIHALREEGDGPPRTGSAAIFYFYPRPPRGGRLRASVCPAYILQFLSTPSARRATRLPHHPHGAVRISIHALREEGDWKTPKPPTMTRHFYPRPPRGGRQGREPDLHYDPYFYPRPPRGGRPQTIAKIAYLYLFLSTPSARRATILGFGYPYKMINFYPRPPRGGRRGDPLQPVHRQGISIHALREEGDTPLPVSGRYFSTFLSTPSARRATVPGVLQYLAVEISIHALREEGDLGKS